MKCRHLNGHLNLLNLITSTISSSQQVDRSAKHRAKIYYRIKSVNLGILFRVSMTKIVLVKNDHYFNQFLIAYIL